jgi:hypothetical protein
MYDAKGLSLKIWPQNSRYICYYGSHSLTSSGYNGQPHGAKTLNGRWLLPSGWLWRIKVGTMDSCEVAYRSTHLVSVAYFGAKNQSSW